MNPARSSGVALRLRIELQPVEPWVALRLDLVLIPGEPGAEVRDGGRTH